MAICSSKGSLIRVSGIVIAQEGTGEGARKCATISEKKVLKLGRPPICTRESSNHVNMKTRFQKSIHHPRLQATKIPSRSKFVDEYSDEEEDSSDGDDSIHSSDIEFIEDDSEPDPDDDFSCGSESSSDIDSESCIESICSEVMSDDETSEKCGGSARSAEYGERDEQPDLTKAMQDVSISSGPSKEKERDRGGILHWLNERAKFMVGKQP
jgi:hypothetical protein